VKIAIAADPIPGDRLVGFACHPSRPTLPAKKHAVRMRGPSSFGHFAKASIRRICQRPWTRARRQLCLP